MKNYQRTASHIKAIQYDGTNLEEIKEYCPAAVETPTMTTTKGVIVIVTSGRSESIGLLNVGDYYVKDKNGFHIFQKIAFELMYEEIDG